jgi:CDP-diacylglycerol--glycerol-3-phosphate 3-phosphatidyltransferase
LLAGRKGPFPSRRLFDSLQVVKILKLEYFLNPNQEWEIDNLPNRITVFRILLIPIIILCLMVNLGDFTWIAEYRTISGLIAAITFGVAGITDFFDGYIARKRDLTTVFGSFLDPIADKFLVVSSLIMLLALGRIHVIVVTILTLREMYITALRLLASEKGLTVPVSSLGKWKTATQMIGIPMLMIYDYPFGIMGSIFIYIASIISVYSALQYSLKLIAKFKKVRMEKKESYFLRFSGSESSIGYANHACFSNYFPPEE